MSLWIFKINYLQIPGGLCQYDFLAPLRLNIYLDTIVSWTHWLQWQMSSINQDSPWAYPGTAFHPPHATIKPDLWIPIVALSAGCLQASTLAGKGILDKDLQKQIYKTIIHHSSTTITICIHLSNHGLQELPHLSSSELLYLKMEILSIATT